MKIELNAPVQCDDGRYGAVAAVILDPDTTIISHVVVREDAPPHVQRLIPSYAILDIVDRELRLAGLLADFSHYPQFSATAAQRLYRPACQASLRRRKYYSSMYYN
ncbi:MAG: hypothetical protein R3C14_10635 [Caldilineaceae bacterium]